MSSHLTDCFALVDPLRLGFAVFFVTITIIIIIIIIIIIT